SDQIRKPLCALINCVVTRTRLPSRRKLPSSTFSTLSFFPTSLTSVLFPLNENDEVRATTRSPSTLARASIISSLIPSQKYSWFFVSLRSRNGSTAMLFSGGKLVVGFRCQ